MEGGGRRTATLPGGFGTVLGSSLSGEGNIQGGETPVDIPKGETDPPLRIPCSEKDPSVRGGTGRKNGRKSEPDQSPEARPALLHQPRVHESLGDDAPGCLVPVSQEPDLRPRIDKAKMDGQDRTRLPVGHRPSRVDFKNPEKGDRSADRRGILVGGTGKKDSRKKDP
jgi:hypothetical protein